MARRTKSAHTKHSYETLSFAYSKWLERLDNEPEIQEKLTTKQWKEVNARLKQIGELCEQYRMTPQASEKEFVDNVLPLFRENTLVFKERGVIEPSQT